MKLYCVFAQRRMRYEGEYAPELVAAADEYTQDENPEYLQREFERAEASGEFTAVTMVQVDLGPGSTEAITERLTKPLTLKGKVSEGGLTPAP